MKKHNVKLSLVLCLLGVVLVVYQFAPSFFLSPFFEQFDFAQLGSMDQIKSSAKAALDYLALNPLVGTGIFVGIYFFANALPMPFISVLTMLAGYLFGVVYGLLLVSFVGALGSSCLFIMSRYLFKDWVAGLLIKYAPNLDQQRQKNSFAYAVSLRLVPGMPFCIPSIVLSFTGVSVLRFYLSTQLGLLLILFVYVNAGSQLTQLQSMSDILSVPLVISMLLLAVVPFLLNFISKRFFPVQT